MTEKNRGDLRNIFLTGNKPTQDNFADVFESFLNFLDDGVLKSQNGPLSFLPVGTFGSWLQFNTNKQDPSFNWSISQKVASDNAAEGFNIAYLSNSRLFIDTSGNVGLKSSNPQAALHVNQTGENPALKITYDNVNTPSLFVNKTNVGIGTDTPQASLDVVGSLNVSTSINANSLNISQLINTYSLSLSNNWSISPKMTSDYTGEGFDIAYLNDSRLFIDTSGNIGLKNSNPQAALHVNQTGENPALKITYDNDYSPRLFVTKTNVGIGTATPQASLDVSGSLNVSWLITTDSLSSRIINTNSLSSSLIDADSISVSNSIETSVLTVTNSLNIKSAISIETLNKGFTTKGGGISLSVSPEDNRDSHWDNDGALYRWQNQIYLTVDGAFYIRDIGMNNTEFAFYFDTDNKSLTIGNATSAGALYVNGSATIGTAARPATLSVNGSAAITNDIVLGTPAATIFTKGGGIVLSDGSGAQNRPSHCDFDGALYRWQNQIYLTVDGAFYIRDKDMQNAEYAFYFNTDSRSLTIGTPTLPGTLTVNGSATTGALRVNGSATITSDIILQTLGAAIITKGGGIVLSDGSSEQNRSTHCDFDGALYRYGGIAYLAIDDQFSIRKTNSSEYAFNFKADTRALTIGSGTQQGSVNVYGPIMAKNISLSTISLSTTENINFTPFYIKGKGTTTGSVIVNIGNNSVTLTPNSGIALLEMDPITHIVYNNYYYDTNTSNANVDALQTELLNYITFRSNLIFILITLGPWESKLSSNTYLQQRFNDLKLAFGASVFISPTTTGRPYAAIFRKSTNMAVESLKPQNSGYFAEISGWLMPNNFIAFTN